MQLVAVHLFSHADHTVGRTIEQNDGQNVGVMSIMEKSVSICELGEPYMHYSSFSQQLLRLVLRLIFCPAALILCVASTTSSDETETL